MLLTVRHTTRYVFAEPVAYGVQRLRLTPKETQGQKIINWSMEFAGAKEELSYDDQNFNHVTLVSVLPGAQEVIISCHGMVETEDHHGVIGRHSGHMPLWAFLGHSALTRPGPCLRQLVGSLELGTDLVAMLHRLSALVRAAIAYEVGTTDVETTAEEALVHGRGVCQDHAHAFIAAARMLDVPARYVSGYLLLEDRVHQEATHAWAEAYVDGLGWVGFDVSNQISPDARYVRVATGRDYRDAAPVVGVSFGTTNEDLHVELAVAQQGAEQ